MKFDPKYSSQIKPVYRVFAGIISLPMLLFGIMAISELLNGEKTQIKEITKIAIPQIGFGTLMLIASIKGQLPKIFDGISSDNNEEPSLLSETKRKNSLKMLTSMFGVAVIFSSMFYMFEKFSVIWWLTAALSAFWLYMYYLSSQLLLMRYRFHHLLSLTIIFPIAILLIGIISPEILEKREDVGEA